MAGFECRILGWLVLFLYGFNLFERWGGIERIFIEF